MAANAIRFGRAVVELAADQTPLMGALQDVEGRLLRFTTRLGATLAGSGAATLFGLIPAIKTASNQAETLNAFTQTFAGANAEATKLVQTLSNDVGRSVASIQGLATPIGAMAKGLGLSSQAAAEFATQASAAAIDISSFYNQDVEATAQRIRAALSGSSEAVDQFGINLRASALSAKLAALGYDSNLQSASELEKTLARLALIQEALARQNALGDAARTADQFANSSRSLSDGLTQLSANIGNALLPAAEQITQVLVAATNAVAGFVGRNPLLVQGLAAMAVAAVAAGTALLGLVAAAQALLLFGKVALIIQLARLAFATLAPVVAAAMTAIVTFTTTNVAAATAVTGLSAAVGRLGLVLQTSLLPLLAKLPLLRLLIPLVGGLGTAFAALTSPIGLVVAGIAAIGVAIVGVYKLANAQEEARGKELDRRLAELQAKRAAREAAAQAAGGPAAAQAPGDAAAAPGFDAHQSALEAFAGAVANEVLTAEEQFGQQMERLFEAAMTGLITQEQFVRAEAQARERLAESQARLAEEMARDAEEAAQAWKAAVEQRTDRQIRIARAQGDQRGEFKARERGLDGLAEAGFLQEAQFGALDLYGEIIGRSRDIEKRASENQAGAGFGTFSRLEAVAGLGTNTVDQQLLAEAKEAKQQRERYEKLLSELLDVMRGED